MCSPPSTETRKATAELDKLKLEIEQLRKDRKWYWTMLRLPVLSTLIAALGIVVTVWQVQRTERAQIDERTARLQNETAERINKIQSQIQFDEGLLTNFESDSKVSPSQAVFLVDDLGRLVRQLPDRESEEQDVTRHLGDIVWSLRFEEKRDFDLEAKLLGRWPAYRKHWRSYPESHHLFLTRKYYTKIDKLRSCLQQIVLTGNDFDYSSMPKDCDQELVGAVVYGAGQHFNVARETNEAELQREVDEFIKFSNNAALGYELKRQTQAR